MEFYQKKAQSLPFFMTYPDDSGTGREGNTLQTNGRKDSVLKDMEYLQQTYPNEVKKYQRKVAEILDKLDYEGSMIYDEYPDRYCLQRLAKTILQILQSEESGARPADSVPSEKWEWVEALIQVLLCNEIYKRRHGGRRGFFMI